MCDCSLPPNVDLSDRFSDPQRSTAEAVTLLLQNNLQRYGWSPISISAASAATATAGSNKCSRFDQLLHDYPNWKKSLVELFDEQSVDHNATITAQGHALTFRTNESGSQATELKQSWEITRRRRRSSSSVHSHHDSGTTSTEKTEAHVVASPKFDRLVDSIELLHQVAVTVRQILQLPENVLLRENVDQQDDDDNDNVDLMRVFYYDVIPRESTSSSLPSAEVSALGSSPHTDWGSFTVVWQDGVGGLQTFCRKCQTWKDVPAAAAAATATVDSNTAQFVVHCSDLTSLAMQQHWQSPKHRVLSPQHEKRISLVYFAYPPPDRTLQQITEALQSYRMKMQMQGGDDNNDDEQTTRTRLPVIVDYDQYSLLQNQSSPSEPQQRLEQTWSAQAQYERILNLPLRQVLHEKWQQVQRTNY